MRKINKFISRKLKMKGTKSRPRLSVFRSNKTILAQIINDEKGRTLVAASEKDMEKVSELPASRDSSGIQSDKVAKTERARMVGETLAKKAMRKKIKTVVFDRGRYKYHGRVKALAEGARKGGLKF